MAEAAERLAERYPGHPAGPFYRGIVAYQRYLQQDAGAQASLAAFAQASARAFDAAAAVESTLPALAYSAGTPRRSASRATRCPPSSRR